MAKNKYLTAPLPSKKMPAGIPYILTNEAAERFSFYGNRCILVFFMTHLLKSAAGQLDPMTPEQSKFWFHLFVSAVYFTPLIGALLSDIWLAKYRTIIFFSIIYCFGFFAITIDHTRLGLGVGLILIALGSGVIKPCVSANVGDQFGRTNQHLMPKIYSWFYFAINLGAFISNALVPELLRWYGPTIAFGTPCCFMVIATIAFWMGHKKFVHIPRGGIGFVKECFSGEGLRAIGKLCIIYLFIAPFWALFDQIDSAWMLQAEKMNRHLLFFELHPTQVVAANPLMIMLLIPVFSYVIYPAINKVFALTALRKIGIGLFVAALSFVVPAWVENQITGGDIFKCSSMSIVEGLEPFRLLDGVTNGTGWSSSKAPSVNEPIELVIRLRERRAWTINNIKVDPSTILSPAEIEAMLDNIALEMLKKSKQLKERSESFEDEISNLVNKAEVLRAATHKIKKISTAKEAKALAKEVLEDVGESTSLLQDKLYSPKEISLFAANFTGRLLPKLFSELSDQQKQRVTDPIQFAADNGWTYIRTFTLIKSDAPSRFQFDPISATHILIQIKSNYDADRVKIGEIRVLTSEPIPSKSIPFASEIWPNVAGIGFEPPIIWLLLAYVILTAAEVMVSITCLEFSYTQAPKKMKSFIMAVFFLSITLGNIFTAAVNKFIQNEDGTSKLPGASYFWFFVGVMLVTAVLFIPVAARYKVKDYIQDEASAESSA